MPNPSLSSRILYNQSLIENFDVNSKVIFSEDVLFETLLCFIAPRIKNRESVLKEIKKIGFQELIFAEDSRIDSIKGLNFSSAYVAIKLIKEIIITVLHSLIIKKRVPEVYSKLIGYLQAVMGYAKTEHFRALFLDEKYTLIKEEIQSFGTIDQTTVFPRELVKRILFFQAASIILVHNHPSGNPTPSEADKLITKNIINACKIIDVTVYDHIIVASHSFFSFKENNLL